MDNTRTLTVMYGYRHNHVKEIKAYDIIQRAQIIITVKWRNMIIHNVLHEM